MQVISGSEYVPPNQEPFFGELENVGVPDIADVDFRNNTFLNLLDVVPLAKAEWIADDNNSMMEMEAIFQVPNLQGMSTVDRPSNFNLMDLKDICKFFTV
eukprot:11139166-Ditylum_brightwellii.AAC.1